MTEPVRDDAELLRAHLARHSAPCPQCGFNLRALESGRCPECGHALRLVVGSATYPRGSGFMTAMTLAAGAGAAGTVVFAAFVQSAMALSRGRLRFEVDYDAGHALASLVALPVFLVALSVWLAADRAPRRSRLGLQRVAMVGAGFMLLGYAAAMALIG